jgi:flagellar motor switch/type III secretory pathway protein FliN
MLNGQLAEQTPEYGGGVTADLELERISLVHLDLLNALYRAPALPFHLDQQEIFARAEWSPKPLDISDPWTVTVSLNDQTVELVAPYDILQKLLARLDPQLALSDLSGELRTLLLELALQQVLEQIEQIFQTSLSIQGVVKGGRTQLLQEHGAVVLRIEGPGHSASRCQLRFTSSSFEHLTAHQDYFSAHERRAVNVSLPANVRWGMVDLPIDELRSLNPGDIILPDHSCETPATAFLVIADQLVAKVECKPGGYRLTSRFHAPEAGNEWVLDRQRAANAALSDTLVKDMTVRVFIERDEFSLDRSTVKTVTRHDVVRIAGEADEGVGLMVGGVRIGCGELTQIGGAIGVRVTRL